jgi:hypothetical protein
MKYFLPDSQDLVDPSFDFETEDRSRTRIRQRDDVYAHELFPDRVSDGLLVSKGLVDGFGQGGGRYSIAQRHRLLRVGAPEFFRLANAGARPLSLMGDCGAFAYIKEDKPPYSVEDVATFYVDCEFDFGISVDHLIPEYQPAWDNPRTLVAEERAERNRAKERQELTLELASEFLSVVKKGKLRFEPLGVAQGWSPKSYADATKQLQKMGYSYIALGGMVPLKTTQIEESLAAVNVERSSKTRLHLLGVTRTEKIPTFSGYGVASFDSTSPLRQAFKDDRDNYYTMDRTYAAIRIPQIEGNPKLERSIRAGKTSQGQARAMERACLDVMARFDKGTASIDETLDALTAYDELFAAAEESKKGSRRSHRELYREVLAARPWKACPCAVCKALGHHVVIFRGAERNRRRGLHNVWMFYRRVQQQLASVAKPATSTRRKRRATETPNEERAASTGARG